MIAVRPSDSAVIQLVPAGIIGSVTPRQTAERTTTIDASETQTPRIAPGRLSSHSCATATETLELVPQVLVVNVVVVLHFRGLDERAQQARRNGRRRPASGQRSDPSHPRPRSFVVHSALRKFSIAS